MQTGSRQNDRVKSIMKSKADEDHSTGDIEDDSFADDDSSVDSSGSHQVGSDAGSSSMPTGARRQKPNALQIARRETTYVLCSKTMAYLVLLLSSIACGVFTYYFIQGEQEEALKDDVRAVLCDLTTTLSAASCEKTKQLTLCSFFFVTTV